MTCVEGVDHAAVARAGRALPTALHSARLLDWTSACRIHSQDARLAFLSAAGRFRLLPVVGRRRRLVLLDHRIVGQILYVRLIEILAATSRHFSRRPLSKRMKTMGMLNRAYNKSAVLIRELSLFRQT